MKRWLGLLIVLLLAGCDPAPAAGGELATPGFSAKYNSYIEMYDHLFFSPEGLSVALDAYYDQVYAGDTPDFSGDFEFGPQAETARLLDEAIRFSEREPRSEKLDQAVRSAGLATRDILTTLELIDQQMKPGAVRDLALLEELDARLSEEIDTANNLFADMSQAMFDIRDQRNRQLISRYEANKQVIAAELLRATMVLNRISDAIDINIDGQRVDLEQFSQDITSLAGHEDKLKSLSQDDKQLKALDLTADDLNQGLSYLEKLRPVLADLAEAVRQNQPMGQNEVEQFDALYYPFLDYVEVRLP